LAAAGHAGHFRGGRSANGSFELLATLIVGPPLIWLCSLPIAIAIYKSTVKDWTGTPALPIALYCMGLVLTAMAFSLVAMAG
jgi:hypothetical protein